MALWPTCPESGLPDTEARSSRKYFKIHCSHPNVFRFLKPVNTLFEVGLCYNCQDHTDHHGPPADSPRTTPRSLST